MIKLKIGFYVVFAVSFLIMFVRVAMGFEVMNTSDMHDRFMICILIFLAVVENTHCALKHYTAKEVS